MTRALAGLAIALCLCAPPHAAGAEAFEVRLELIGTYSSEAVDKAAANDVAYSAKTKSLYVANAHLDSIDIVSIFNPAAPRLVRHVAVANWGPRLNALAVHGDTIAAAIAAARADERGVIALFDLDGKFVRSFPAGYSPGSVAFSPDGAYVVSADEGVPLETYSADPPGSLTLAAADGSSVQTIGFDAAPTEHLHFGAPPDTSRFADLEPEQVAFSPDGKQIFVTLQENNGIAIADVATASLTSVFGLGVKDWSGASPGAPVAPVFGLFQPSGLAAIKLGSSTYLITANEGMARRTKAYADGVRLSEATLDPTQFDGKAREALLARQGDMPVSIAAGDTDGDGDLDKLVAFGGRSVSIWSPDGALVGDTGDAISNTLSTPQEATEAPKNNIAPAPRALAAAKVKGRTVAFVGLRNRQDLLAFDVSDPSLPRLVGQSGLQGATADGTGDKPVSSGPSSLIYIRGADSPTGRPLLAAAFPEAGSVALYKVAAEGTAQPVAPVREISPAPPAPVAQVPEQTEPPPTAPSPEPAAGVGRFQLQIAAAATPEEAAKLAARVLKDHATILAQAPSQIVKAELDGGRTLYRVRIGAFDDRQSADEACARLKSAGQDCFIVAR